MKIAVPLFKGRISPHFGVSCKILLVETDDRKITHKSVVDIGADNAARIARHLASRGVNTIICGGIQRVHKQWLVNNGIHVVDNQKGPAEEFVFNMLASELFSKNE